MPVVTQLFDKINVTSKFLAEDMHKEAVPVDEAPDAEGDAPHTPGKERTKQQKAASRFAKAEAAKPAVVDWDDVFQDSVADVVSVLPSAATSPTPPTREHDSEIDDTEDEDEGEGDQGDIVAATSKGAAKDGASEVDPAITRKKVRMTTNKGKVGVHYYETANVKNRNREKKRRLVVKPSRKT